MIEGLGYFCDQLENGEIQLTEILVTEEERLAAMLEAMDPKLRAAMEWAWEQNKDGLMYLADK